MSLSTKRARANTAGKGLVKSPAPTASTKPIPTARQMETLGPKKISALLLKAAEMHPDVNNLLVKTIDSVKKQQQKRVINFDHYSPSIWKLINVTHRKKSGPKQYDVSFDVVSDINSIIDDIVKGCDKYANPGTRLNGLSVLRKIGKTIFSDSTDILGSEVQRQFSQDGGYGYADAIRHIVSAMSVEERRNIVSNASEPDALWPKLHELKGLFDDNICFEDFQDVLDLLAGKREKLEVEDEYEDQEDEDEEDEEDDY